MTRRCFPYGTKGRPEREEGTGLCQFQRRRIGPASFRFGKEGEDEEEYQEEHPRKERQNEGGYSHPGVFGPRFSYAPPRIANQTS
jgi:hypothetical protein